MTYTNTRLRRSASILCVLILGALASSSRAIGANTVLIFRELDRGATFHFIDNAPKATLIHGSASISPGDMLVLTNPLAVEGRVVGKMRIVCTATSHGDTRHLSKASLNCTGIARFPNGSLFLAGELGRSPVEGAVIGGTGNFAAASGTFISENGKGFSTTTITLTG